MNDCAKRKDWSWQETAPDENVGSSQLEKEAGVTELYVDVREKHTFVTDWPWALRDEKRWRWLLAFAPQLVSGEAINWVRGEEGYCLGWKWKLLSRPTLRHSMDCIVSPWDCAGQNTGVGGLSFLQGIFPTQGLNPGLLHCKWILYQLSHKGRWRILDWVAYPFSSGSSRPRNRTGFSCIAGGFFTNWAMTCYVLA